MPLPLVSTPICINCLSCVASASRAPCPPGFGQSSFGNPGWPCHVVILIRQKLQNSSALLASVTCSQLRLFQTDSRQMLRLALSSHHLTPYQLPRYRDINTIIKSPNNWNLGSVLLHDENFQDWEEHASTTSSLMTGPVIPLSRQIFRCGSNAVWHD
jgi:hypothetical protein